MKLTIRDYSSHKDYPHYDTARLREEYVIEQVFGIDEILLTYSYIDRIIVGGVIPLSKVVELGSAPEIRAEHFLDRREMGVINIGGEGTITVDGKKYELSHWDSLYVGRGAKEVTFASKDPKNPAHFYIASSPAHVHYDNKLIHLEEAEHRHLGSLEECNKRTINRIIVPENVKTAQLTMGLTHLEPGSNWNTMPSHTHDRRMEVYLYFDMKENDAVFHMMGTQRETRHVILHNEQAVISPSWSIHSGVGTSNYTFIWAMCGENQDFDDMDNIETKDLL